MQLWFRLSKRLYIEHRMNTEHQTYISTQQIGEKTDVEEGKTEIQRRRRNESFVAINSEMNVKKIENENAECTNKRMDGWFVGNRCIVKKHSSKRTPL